MQMAAALPRPSRQSRRRSRQRANLAVKEEPHRRGEFVAARVARPEVAHVRLADEFGSCGREQEVVAVGAAGQSDTTRRDRSGMRLDLSGHGILLRLTSPLHRVPRILKCCPGSLARAWRMDEVFIKSN